MPWDMFDVVQVQHRYLVFHNMINSLQALKCFCEEDDMKKLAEKHANILRSVERLSAHALHILQHVDKLVEKLYSISKLYRRLTRYMQLDMLDFDEIFYEQNYSAEYDIVVLDLTNMKELVELCVLMHNSWEMKLNEMMFILQTKTEIKNKVYDIVDKFSRRARPVFSTYELVQNILKDMQQNMQQDQQESNIAEFCTIFYDAYKILQKTLQKTL